MLVAACVFTSPVSVQAACKLTVGSGVSPLIFNMSTKVASDHPDFLKLNGNTLSVTVTWNASEDCFLPITVDVGTTNIQGVGFTRIDSKPTVFNSRSGSETYEFRTQTPLGHARFNVNITVRAEDIAWRSEVWEGCFLYDTDKNEECTKNGAEMGNVTKSWGDQRDSRADGFSSTGHAGPIDLHGDALGVSYSHKGDASSLSNVVVSVDPASMSGARLLGTPLDTFQVSIDSYIAPLPSSGFLTQFLTTDGDGKEVPVSKRVPLVPDYKDGHNYFDRMYAEQDSSSGRTVWIDHDISYDDWYDYYVKQDKKVHTSKTTLPFDKDKMQAVFDSVMAKRRVFMRLTQPDSWEGGDALTGVPATFVPGKTVMEQTVPMTNCLHVGGNGPIKMAFMSGGNSETYEPGERETLLRRVNYIVNHGIKVIDPYKKYQDKFSYYIDLEKIDQNEMTIEETKDPGGRTWAIFDYSMNSWLINSSACGNEMEVYTFLFDHPKIIPAWATMHGRNVYLNVHPGIPLGGPTDPVSNLEIFSENPMSLPLWQNLPRVAMHELAHALGGLNDEYVYVSPDDELGYSDLLSITTCSTQPQIDYRGSDGLIYGLTDKKGCDQFWGKDEKTPYYRASHTSIMNGNYRDLSINVFPAIYKFNIISCGYLTAVFKGMAPERQNAATFWPECEQLDTVKDGLPTY